MSFQTDIYVIPNLIWNLYNGKADGFTKKYSVHLLVYYEGIEDINSAINQEKRIKAWKREWKIALIEKNNPDWKDLYESLLF